MEAGGADPTPAQATLLERIARRVDPAELSSRLASRVGDLATVLRGEKPITMGRAEWRFGARGSLSVTVAGPKRGRWRDFEAGVRGGPLALVRHLRRCDFAAALAWARAWLGDAGPPEPLETPRAAPGRRAPSTPSEPRTLDLARRLWREAGADDGRLARYLAGRGGLELEPDMPVRFHPRAWRNRAFGPPGPAMVALMTDPRSGRPRGVHITYLRADGSGKAKGERPRIVLGRAGVVRLVPDVQVTLGLGLAEGIETGLAVMQAFRWRPVWAAGSAGRIADFPMLPGIEALTVFADTDDRGAGMDAAQACARRWAAAGRDARIIAARADTDFNDAVLGRAA